MSPVRAGSCHTPRESLGSLRCRWRGGVPPIPYLSVPVALVRASRSNYNILAVDTHQCILFSFLMMLDEVDEALLINGIIFPLNAEYVVFIVLNAFCSYDVCDVCVESKVDIHDT